VVFAQKKKSQFTSVAYICIVANALLVPADFKLSSAAVVAAQKNSPLLAQTSDASMPPVQLRGPQTNSNAGGNTNPSPPKQLRVEQNQLVGPLLLSEAVALADKNYPTILKTEAEKRAAKIDITVQKLTEYMPESLLQTQDIISTRNKITQNFYGSPVFLADAGPGSSGISARMIGFSGAGFNLDWAPLDFGLHKSRIQLAKRMSDVSSTQADVTKFDAEISAASAYLDNIQALRQVTAVELNVRSFEEFVRIVDTQVKTNLKPSVDLDLAEAQLANAQNDLYRAKLGMRITEFSLANSVGLPDADVKVVDKGLADLIDKSQPYSGRPKFEMVPIAQNASSELLVALAQKKVLQHEYDPVFHFLGGEQQQRGSPVTPSGQLTGRDGYGFLPATPNFQFALIVNWNFLDVFRLRYMKKAQDQHIIAQQSQCNFVLNNLKTLDRQSRAKLETAIDIANNMPAQVNAAVSAQKQAFVRYTVGLSSVAQVAEANQMVAQARMQQAVAYVNVWRAILQIASAHGDLKPFLAESDRTQRL
jgi:outer membrane protein